jgi:hypothetical protein
LADAAYWRILGHVPRYRARTAPRWKACRFAA